MRSITIYFVDSDSLTLTDVQHLDMYESQEMPGYRCPKGLLVRTPKAHYTIMMDKVLYYRTEETE